MEHNIHPKAAAVEAGQANPSVKPPKPRDLVIVRKALDRTADLESAMVKLRKRRERLRAQADTLAPALSA